MSAITSGRRAPRVTARVSTIISSIEAGTVESWPRTVIAAESPTRIRSTPDSSARRPDGVSYAVTITIGWWRSFISASSVIGSLPGAGVPGAGVRGRVLTIPPSRIEGDVVDQAGRADADGGGERGRVERRHGDVLDVEPGGVEDRARRLRIARRERARKGERAGALLR